MIAEKIFARHMTVDLRAERYGVPAVREGDAGFALADMLMDCGQNRPAIACLQRLLSIDPQDAAAWQNLAVAYFVSGRYAEGIASCQEALKIDPEQTTAMYNLALAYVRRGDRRTGMAWIRQALQIDPQDIELQRLELRLRLALTWEWIRKKVGRLHEMIAELEGRLSALDSDASTDCSAYHVGAQFGSLSRSPVPAP